jgi:hypothetical protein
VTDGPFLSLDQSARSGAGANVTPLVRNSNHIESCWVVLRMLLRGMKPSTGRKTRAIRLIKGWAKLPHSSQRRARMATVVAVRDMRWD